jgi:hypothetical protein
VSKSLHFRVSNERRTFGLGVFLVHGRLHFVVATMRLEVSFS